MNIDWLNPKSKISKYFTTHEATFLPSFHCYHIPSNQEKQNIILMAQKMDIIREFLNTSITVSVWIRPTKVNCPTFDPKLIKLKENDPRQKALDDLNYNLFIGSTATKSAHIQGLAVDFTTKDLTPDEVREKLVPKIDEFQIRIELLPGSSWVHVDNMWIKGGHNYFIP